MEFTFSSPSAVLADLLSHSISRSPDFNLSSIVTSLWAFLSSLLGFLYGSHQTKSPRRPVATCPYLTFSATRDEKAGREPRGHFEYPRFDANVDFDFEKRLPPAYRPFKWGPNYHVTMGLRNGDWADWIELDNRFGEYHRIKSYRLAARGDRCVQTLPGNDIVPGGAEAAREVVQELAEYLSRRYPQVYSAKRATPRHGDYGWYNEGQITSITIKPLNVTYDLQKEDPMTVAGMLVQEDLAIMVPGSDGKHYLQAGSILLGGTWRLEDKIGKSLSDIHTSGDVPQYKEKLEFSMDQFFSKLQPNKLVLRNNYFFQVRYAMPPEGPARAADPCEISWSTSSLGPEESYAASHEPGEQAVYGPYQPSKRAANVEDVFFRTERQSLRRLPRSGAVLFTIRTYHDPVTRLAQEPGVPGRMASAIRSWPEDVADYKGQHRYRDILLEHLDQVHEEQVENGLDRSDAKYPF